MKVLLATSNPGKVEEIRRILAPLGWEIVLPPGKVKVEEEGTSYLENALLKAEAYFNEFGIPALADDSGLEVEALGGYPGIYSGRFWSVEFGGLEESDSSRDLKNIKKLLRLLEGKKDRRAKFVAVVVLYMGSGFLSAKGVCEGRILTSPRGEGGFGYDPVFQPKGKNRSFAELNPREKDSISHRGRALRNLVHLIRDIQLCSSPSP